MKCIYVDTNNNISIGNISMKKLINTYELYCPISKYALSIGVKPIENLQKQERKVNTIGTNIYKGEMFGNIVIVSDNEDDIDVYFKELNDGYVKK